MNPRIKHAASGVAKVVYRNINSEDLRENNINKSIIRKSYNKWFSDGIF